MMQSPPKTAFAIVGTPNKRHKKNDYNPYVATWSATKNPQIQYSSPPRKRNRNQANRTLSAPRIRYNTDSANHHSSPISSRYSSRIGTSLYDDSEDKQISHRKRKYLSSPISPTFQPIYRSPCKQKGRTTKHYITNSCDRYTPRHGDMNRYDIHSPTKRFVHNNAANMMSYTNIIRPSKRKRRKLGQNYSGTNDDPSSLNHRLKQKLSQHAYNQVLQSELLGFSAQYSNVVNQVFNDNNEDDTQKNDNISAIQICMETNNGEESKECNDNEQEAKYNEDAIDNDMIEDSHHHTNIYGSPSLPNRRIVPDRNTPTRNRNNERDDETKRNKKRNSTKYKNISHHPLCPCYNKNNNNTFERREHEESHSNSEESDHEAIDGDTYDADAYALCVCDSITSNVATNFLMSPQRTLRYRGHHDENEENEMENNEMNHIRMTPIKASSQSVLSGSRKSMRNIAKSPFKVLDAPRLTDDFYLNLVDWSSSCNILSVGLGECVYLWSAYTSKVTKLVDLTKLFEENQFILENDEYLDGYDMVTAVAWSKNHEYRLNSGCIVDGSCSTFKQEATSSDYLAVGSGSGYVFVFDTVKSKLARSPLTKHGHRVGVIAWKDNNILCSGSRDRNIYLRDMRIPDSESDITSKLIFHKQEVCGLKWSQDSLYLASGGNDNKLAIWDIRHSNKPLCYGKHKAAVKAITWSPHDSALIASGGGTADRCIKFWNINNFISSSAANKKANGLMNHHHKTNSIIALKPIQVIDTGSQVCNLLWSKNVNEIVSTHGYSLNQIVVWKYPSMDKIVTLTGHTYRVLYLAGSPDGQTVVTGAGDETLRLWNIFPPISNHDQNNQFNNFVPKPYSIPLHIR